MFLDVTGVPKHFLIWLSVINTKLKSTQRVLSKWHVENVENCASKSTLVMHMRLHEGVDSLSRGGGACDICNMTYQTKNGLQQHPQTHLEEKIEASTAHICEVCRKKFNMGTSLSCHMRSAHYVPNYTCSICNRAFTCKSGLGTHKPMIRLVFIH